MTSSEALSEARRRWGPAGEVREHPGDLPPEFQVGVMEEGMFVRKGRGFSFEEAFADSDRRAGGES